MDQPEKPRWQYRFDNFSRAFLLLREAIETAQTRELTQLEKEGVIQRFEYTMELAWNTLKDYLEYENVVLDKVTPRHVLKKAFESNLVREGDVWQSALDSRNKMSHTYNFQKFEAVIQAIEADYLRVLGDLYQTLLQEIVEGFPRA